MPSRMDCLACHGSAIVPVLGFNALQLSPERDSLGQAARPAGQGTIDLRALVARGWVRNLPDSLQAWPLGLPGDSPVERAALGYFQGNCAHCHNASANRVPTKLNLALSVADPRGSREQVLRSILNSPTRWQPSESNDAVAIVPGNATESALIHRMRSRDSRIQMPPLGTQWIDPEGLALVMRWINAMPANP